MRYSGRLPSRFEPNRLTRFLDDLKRAGKPLLDLTVTNPTQVGLPTWTDGFLERAFEASTAYDPDPAGSRPAREAVAGYYAARGSPVDPERVVLTASTSEAYAWLFKLLADPRGEFLVPAPSYPLFQPLAALEAVSLRHYPLRFDGRWWLDGPALESAVSPLTRGIVVVEPNNPTGSVLLEEETAAVASLAARNDIPVIADQVFGDFLSSAGRLPAFFSRAPGGLSFTLSGISKVAGLPQMKVGWILIGGPTEAAAAARERLEWIADSYLSVSTPAQLAIPAWLDHAHIFQAATRERLNQNEATLREVLLGAPSTTLLPRQGGWSFVLRVPRVRTEEEWCLKLLERGVLLHPGHFYDFEDEAWLVGSLIARPEVLKQGMERLVEVIEA